MSDRDRPPRIVDLIPSYVMEGMVYERLLDIANQASTHRDERLALTVKRMPRTLLVFVPLTACTILFLLFLFPFRSAALGGVAIEGTWNVGAQSFEELLSKFR